MAKQITSGLTELYLKHEIEAQKERYAKATKAFCEFFNTDDTGLRYFSAPGRTEVGGNHTDHNHGKVLAASVNLDVIAVVKETGDGKITIKSEGFPVDEISIDDLEARESEKNTSAALIRGVAAGFAAQGLAIGGFQAYTVSSVLKGSGLSSSAAFEVLTGTILSGLFNRGAISPVTIAQIAQLAENVYFGKPSGLMDQMASSVGGFTAIDFKNTKAPIIENIPLKFEKFNHALCIIDTKADHADLTAEYSAIPNEMKQIANYFSVDYLREICRADVILNINLLREQFGDRAVLRALHFFDENERVDKLAHSLKNGNFDDFLSSINESGNSSYKYLQNIFAVSDHTSQAIGIALNVAEHALARKGACRVHGGGFAGTIQAFVPLELLKRFKMDMEKVFGAGSCHILTIRSIGGTEVLPNS
ncbi:MAG: galactokinase [Eubacterium sp.]|nr:galactokinase [Eubacterium sp.]